MASKFTLVRGNEYKNGYVGFSWLTLFFSWWVALFRKDWKWFAIMLLVPNVISFLLHFVLSLIMSVVGVSDATIDTVAALVSWLMVTLPSQIYFGYVYNKKYTEKLIREGFKPVDGASAQLVNVKMDNANITNTNASTKGTGVSSLRASLAASKSTDLRVFLLTDESTSSSLNISAFRLPSCAEMTFFANASPIPNPFFVYSEER